MIQYFDWLFCFIVCLLFIIILHKRAVKNTINKMSLKYFIENHVRMHDIKYYEI